MSHSLDSVHEAFMAIERFDHIVGKLWINQSGYMSKDLLDDERVEKSGMGFPGAKRLGRNSWYLWGSDIRRNRRVPHGYAVAIGEKYKGHPRFLYVARISPSPPNRTMAKKALGMIHYMDEFDMPALPVGIVASAVGYALDEESGRRFSSAARRMFDENPFPRHFFSLPDATPGPFSSLSRIREVVLNGIFEKSPKADVKARRWRPTNPSNLIHDGPK